MDRATLQAVLEALQSAAARPIERFEGETEKQFRVYRRGRQDGLIVAIVAVATLLHPAVYRK